MKLVGKMVVKIVKWKVWKQKKSHDLVSIVNELFAGYTRG